MGERHGSRGPETMVEATLDPPFDFCIGHVWARALEIGAHGLGQLLDGDIRVLDLIEPFEITQDITDGALGRM